MAAMATLSQLEALEARVEAEVGGGGTCSLAYEPTLGWTHDTCKHVGDGDGGRWRDGWGEFGEFGR